MVTIIVVLVIVGVVLWYVNTYVPMAPAFKTGINIIAIIVALLYVLQAVGLLDTPPPKLR